MSGNVWEWVSDWYRPDYYRQLARQSGVATNPQGPPSSFDPSEPGVPKRVQRGGSFLCTEQYCTRYMVGARGRGEPTTPSNHVGFRTVRDASYSLALIDGRPEPACASVPNVRGVRRQRGVDSVRSSTFSIAPP